MLILNMGILSNPTWALNSYPSSPPPHSPDPSAQQILLTPQDTKFRTALLISGLTLATGLYGFTSWWDNSSSQFEVRQEHWFGQDSPNGGADKLGHGFSAYIATRLLTKGFQWAGHDQSQSAWLAGLTSGALLTGVEIMDGFTAEYGFSTEDALMNLTGISLGILLESHPTLDNLLDLRLQYWVSKDARRLNDYDPVADYSGQTYLLITKASGIPTLNRYPILRYLEFAMGYGTRGYQPTDGTDSQEKSRNLYYGLSINLSQLLNDKIFPSQSSSLNTVTRHLLEYVQIPGTAVLLKHKL